MQDIDEKVCLMALLIQHSTLIKGAAHRNIYRNIVLKGFQVQRTGTFYMKFKLIIRIL